MKRTTPGGSNKLVTQADIKTFVSEVIGRANLAVRLGYQYGGDRDMYQALGYPMPADLGYDDYAARYSRQDIARAIIDRPIRVTWRGPLQIIESDDDKETPLEKAWMELEDQLGMKSRFVRLDKLTGLGRYGVLLLGLSDVQKKEDYALPVQGTKLKLLYIKPLGEGNAKISKYEARTANERYGLPTEYEITITDTMTNTSSRILVHWTRVIHVVDEMMESEVEGTPRLQPVFNRLLDLEKVVGGDAEMFWRGARPGYQGKLDEKFTMTPATKEDLQGQVDEFNNNLSRLFINEGVELKALEQQIAANPQNHVDILIQMISAVTGIPKRILTGSERGELSSSQDKDEWNSFVQSRREEYAEPRIVRPFVEACIKYGILPKPAEGSFDVKWEDLFAPSEKDKVDIGKIRAEALAKYAASPMSEGVMPPEAFLRWILGFSEADIELIMEMQAAFVKEEGILTPEEEEIIAQTPIIPPVIVQSALITQLQVDPVDWKKVYEDGGAHWMADLQPSQFAQEFALKLVEENKTSVLEIGCANGKDSILFAIAGLSVTGIDIVPEAVEVAKENAVRAGVIVNFQEGNAEELSFSDTSFDAVYSLSVLHSTDMVKSLSEVARVLKPGGLGAIFIYSDSQKIDGTVTEFVMMDEFIDLLKNNGFSITDIYTHQDEDYDEAGEKHSIIVTQIQKDGE